MSTSSKEIGIRSSRRANTEPNNILDKKVLSNSSSDLDLVESLLTHFSGSTKAATISQILLSRFDSYIGIISAPYEALLKNGLDAQTAIAFRIIHVSVQRFLTDRLKKLPVISSYDVLKDYLKFTLGQKKIEYLKVLFLDSANYLILDEDHSIGTVNSVAVYPREIIKRALELNATAIILVHNHPSDDLTPSDEDIKMTLELKRVSQLLSINLHDHILVGRSGILSFRRLGMI